MPTLKGSKTEINLLSGFAGEAQARNRYTYFSEKAKEEGYDQIAAIFLETAEQEREHAKRMFKFLQGGEVTITASFPAGIISNTLNNLKEAAAGEHHENSELYPAFAKDAKEEGFNEIAAAFNAIIIAEKFHEKRYNELAGNIMADKVFKKDHKVTWKCRNCGYTAESDKAPMKCPACEYPTAAFEMMVPNW